MKKNRLFYSIKMSEICTVQILTSLVIKRVQELSKGATPCISDKEMLSVNYDLVRIAEMEIKQKLVHYTINIKKPNGENKVIETEDLIF